MKPERVRLSKDTLLSDRDIVPADEVVLAAPEFCPEVILSPVDEPVAVEKILLAVLEGIPEDMIPHTDGFVVTKGLVLATLDVCPRGSIVLPVDRVGPAEADGLSWDIEDDDREERMSSEEATWLAERPLLLEKIGTEFIDRGVPLDSPENMADELVPIKLDAMGYCIMEELVYTDKALDKVRAGFVGAAEPLAGLEDETDNMTLVEVDSIEDCVVKAFALIEGTLETRRVEAID